MEAYQQVQNLSLIIQPGDSFFPIVDAIDAAKQTIKMTIFRLDDPIVLDALSYAVARKVKVQALVAPASKGWTKRNKKLVDELAKLGVEVRMAWSRKEKEKVKRYHYKMMTIDDQQSMILTFNPTQKNLHYARDFGLLVRDQEITTELNRLFDADWHGDTFRPKDLPLVISPYNSRKKLISLLESAERSIRILDAKVQDQEVIGLLLRKASSGCNVKIITNLQRRGAEIKRSTVVLRAGDLLTPQRIGVALALGVHTVEVVRRPQVACVAPGNELLPPGAALQPGKKWCSNLYAVELRLQELGCTSVNLGIVPDTLESLAEHLQRGLSSDIIVILGASGRGDHDFAAQAMARLGADILFRGVAAAPGRSVTVARCQHTLICGLPGSPWAAFVGFEVFVWPILRALLGVRPVLPPTQPAVLTDALHLRPGVTHFFPAHLRPHAAGLARYAYRQSPGPGPYRAARPRTHHGAGPAPASCRRCASARTKPQCGARLAP